MKIGILTFQRTSNFGSMLQTYALAAAVRALGYNAEVIDYRCSSVESRERLTPKFSSLRDIARYLIVDRKLIKKGKALLSFLMGKCMLSSRRFEKSDLNKSLTEYDIFIVGSDIVWDPLITKSDLTFFSDFVPQNKGKISFASSLGKEPYYNSLFWEKAFYNLTLFDSIAVREEKTAKIFSDYLKRDVKWVCDPTLLLDVNEWNKVTSDKYKGKNYVLVYFNAGTSVEDAIEYAKKINAEVYLVNYSFPVKGTKSISEINLEDFLSLIKYAKCVFTGSYHGMLFSIYFEKEFWFYNRAHAERMISLASRFDLLSRDRGKNQLVMESIDYSKITPLVKEFRNESKKWLNNAILKTEERLKNE